MLEVNHICIEKAVDIVMIVDLLRLARHSHRSEYMYARACSREVFVGSGVVCIMDVFDGVEQTLSRVTGLDLFRGRFLAVHVPCGVRINKQNHRNFAGRTHQRWPWQISHEPAVATAHDVRMAIFYLRHCKTTNSIFLMGPLQAGLDFEIPSVVLQAIV